MPCLLSRYVVVDNVPALGLSAELRTLFAACGTLEVLRPMDERDTPAGTEAFWLAYATVADARSVSLPAPHIHARTAA
jgi:hypothetical protein